MPVRPSRTDTTTLVNYPSQYHLSPVWARQQETDECYNECTKMLTREPKEDLARQVHMMEI
ncbi:hypothetical protein ARMGADRAFT_944889 [Armillaria gallica]|uniref:Uncharacterized protein n=1 Tax=Armillaria gallica TaxID=47427 RepID=A0A2H3CK88_ARMGA|nr:hypothetical protein ARMGADRAFT_944889 [Armillaria gallica]